MVKWGSGWAACAWALVLLAGCDQGAVAETPAAEQEEREPPALGPAARPHEEGLLIGEFRLGKEPIIDGDTIRVEGIEGSIRLLSLDTEERIHGKADRAAIAKDFDQYLERKRLDGARPRKAGTPMGEKAAGFAEAFFRGADTVRLERDDPKEVRGRYGRLLAYAFVQKDGRWTSYNVECVRAGMSPYFTKYGYSHRFHNQLSHAEAEARKAKRGIWNPSAKGYGDYPERKAWWNARADFIRAFEHEANRRDDHIMLSHWDAIERLEERLGKGATVLSTVERIQHFKGLVRVSLALRRERPFPIVFFDETVYRESGISELVREPVVVRGRVERYEKGRYRTLQIVVDDPSQVTVPKLPTTN